MSEQGKASPRRVFLMQVAGASGALAAAVAHFQPAPRLLSL